MNNILKLLFYFTKQNARGSSRQRLCARSRATCYGIYYYFQRSWLCVDPVHTSYSITAPSRLRLLLRKKKYFVFWKKKRKNWLDRSQDAFLSPQHTQTHTERVYFNNQLMKMRFSSCRLYLSVSVFIFFRQETVGFCLISVRSRDVPFLSTEATSYIVVEKRFPSSRRFSYVVSCLDGRLYRWIYFFCECWLNDLTHDVFFQQQLAINPRNNPITLVVKPVLLTNTTWPFLIFPSLSNKLIFFFFPVFLVDLYLN